jgi:hypothetical protein
MCEKTGQQLPCSFNSVFLKMGARKSPFVAVSSLMGSRFVARTTLKKAIILLFAIIFREFLKGRAFCPLIGKR